MRRASTDNQEQIMDHSEELGNETKKTEAGIHKAELDRQIRVLGLEINKAGHQVSAEMQRAQDSSSENKKE